MELTVSDILKRGLPVLLLVLIVAASHYYAYSEGRSLGKAEGSWELACLVVGAEFSHVDASNDDACWCEYGEVVHQSLTMPDRE